MTKRELVLALLKRNPNGVTTGQFLRAGAGSRFGARVQELRERGYTIVSERVRDGEFVYRLLSEREACQMPAQKPGESDAPVAGPSTAPPVADGSAQLFEIDTARPKPASPYDAEAA